MTSPSTAYFFFSGERCCSSVQRISKYLNQDVCTTKREEINVSGTWEYNLSGNAEKHSHKKPALKPLGSPHQVYILYNQKFFEVLFLLELCVLCFCKPFLIYIQK